MGLSTHDKAVLGALFDAEGIVSHQQQHSRSTHEPQADPMTTKEDSEISKKEAQIIKSLDTGSPSPNDLLSALSYFNQVIFAYPDRASAYANRAQVRRMQIADSAIFAESAVETTSAIMDDLSTAISLASASPPSSSTKAVLSSAHAHRGFLLLRAVQLARNGTTPAGLGRELQGATADALEELASRDFAVCGQLGNAEARQISVATNPYAKMCGGIVSEALERERRAFAVQQQDIR